MTHVTCRLTAKNRDQLRNPTLGNRVWATFIFTVNYSPTELQRQRSTTTFRRQLKNFCSSLPTDAGIQTDDCFVVRLLSSVGGAIQMTHSLQFILKALTRGRTVLFGTNNWTDYKQGTSCSLFLLRLFIH